MPKRWFVAQTRRNRETKVTFWIATQGQPVQREGFHHATAAEHQATAYETEQHNAWFKGEVRESMLRDPDLGKRLRRTNLIPGDVRE